MTTNRMTTRQAFEDLIAHRAWWKGIYPDRNAAVQLKFSHKKGLVNESFMEEILKKANYKIVQEKLWMKQGKAQLINI